MWSMWDAPSDRDYYDQFNPVPEEDEEDEEEEEELNETLSTRYAERREHFTNKQPFSEISDDTPF